MVSKWEPQKREIKELYIEQKKPVDEVRRIMENERGFAAGKTGYERQLKRWNFRKNQRQQHFKLIKARLQVRPQQEKDTEVYFRGIILPKLEIQKKVDRCFVSAVEQHMLQRSKGSPDLTVITPTSESYMLNAIGNLSYDLVLPQCWHFSENLETIIKMPEHMLRDMLPNLCPNPSPLVSTHLRQLIKHPSAILPVDQDDHIVTFLQKIFCGEYHLATVEFLKLAIYILSNKLLDASKPAGHLFCSKMLEWFQMGRNYLFVRCILSQKSPTIQAFMENIFASVVFDENEFFL